MIKNDGYYLFHDLFQAEENVLGLDTFNFKEYELWKYFILPAPEIYSV